jgi:hypothetical protein
MVICLQHHHHHQAGGGLEMVSRGRDYYVELGGRWRQDGGTMVGAGWWHNSSGRMLAQYGGRMVA